MIKLIVRIFSGILVASLLTSCGGNGATTRSASLRLTVTWPAHTKVIPLASNSINAVVTAGTRVLGTKVLTYPDGAPQTESVTFTNLSDSRVTLTATAYPNRDATGVAQASGSAPANLTLGQTTTVNVTMTGTIDHIDVTPANPSEAVGDKVTLTATAKDITGAVVLTLGKYTWTSADNTVATPEFPNTARDTMPITGVTPGTAKIAATLDAAEGGKSGSTTVTVAVPGSGCTPGQLGGPGLYPQGAAWPKMGCDNTNSSRVGFGSGATGVLKWISKANVDSASGSSSAVIGADGTVYFGNSLSRTVSALNAGDGARRQDYAQLGPNPTLGAVGLIYAGNSTGLSADDLSTGASKWTLASVGPAGNPIIGANGGVYATVFILNAQGTPVNTVVALNGLTGARGWAVPTVTGAGNLAVDSLGTVYAAAVGGGLNAIEPICGTINWTFVPQAGGNVESGAAVGVAGTVFVRVQSGQSHFLYSVDALTGIENWHVSVLPGTNIPSLTDGGGVFMVAQNGNITAFDQGTGSQRWTFNPPGMSPRAFGSASIDSLGTVYYAVGTVTIDSKMSTLYALNGSTGALNWKFIVPGMVTSTEFTSPVIGADGTIYLADDANGTLIAVK